MKILIIFTIILISSMEAQHCGKLKNPTTKLPWIVSIFSNKSDIVMCQGTIIDKKNVLTAGHCLEHKDPISLLVYSGLVFNRSMDEVESLFGNKKLWQIDQITVHPEKKLTSRGRFINGGFVSSMSIHADLAIATLKQEIEFNEATFPICLPIDNSTVHSKIQGTYGGWNLKNNGVELHNATIEAIEDAEIFEVNEQERFVDFTSGTGLHSNMNDSWTLIGIKMMKNDDHQDGKPTTKFINIHKFVNWIMNVTQNSSSKQSLANGSKGNETSLSSQTENSLKMAIGTRNINILSSPSTVSSTESSQKSSVNQSSETTKTSASKTATESTTSANVLTTEKSTTLNLTMVNGKDSLATTHSVLLTTLSTFKITETSTQSTKTQGFVTQTIQTTTENMASTQNNVPSTITSDTSSSKITTSNVPVIVNSLSTETLSSTTISAIKNDENSLKYETSSMSTPVASSTPIITTFKNETEKSTSSHDSQIDTSTSEKSSKASKSQMKSTTESSVPSTISTVISENVADIPKQLVSKLQNEINTNLPQGRSLKDFTNNLTDAAANLSVISIGLPSATFTKLTTLLPITQNVNNIMSNSTNNTTITDDLPTNILANANETLPVPQNSTDTDERQELLAGLNLPPSMIIGFVFIASLVLLFIVFGILGRGKSTE